MPPNSIVSPSLVESLDSLLQTTPYFDYEVSSTDLFNGAFEIVSFVFPTWKRQEIEFVQCKDGITNQRKYYKQKKNCLNQLNFTFISDKSNT